jgi:hypothetical protein
VHTDSRLAGLISLDEVVERQRNRFLAQSAEESCLPLSAAGQLLPAGLDVIDTYWSGNDLTITNNLVDTTAYHGFDLKGILPDT